MIRKFRFWCKMYISNLRQRFRPELGFKIKDSWNPSLNSWTVDIYDVLDKMTYSYVLSFYRHHERFDFIVHEISESGIDFETYALTPTLEDEINSFIIQKVG